MKNKRMHIIYITIIAILLFVMFISNYSKENIYIHYIPYNMRTDTKKDNWGYLNPQYYHLESLYTSIYSYPTDVCFVGDSITMYCPWNEIFYNYNVKNRGIGSDTTAGILSRLDSIVKTKPAKIFILAGINDIGQGLAIDDIVANYEEIIIQLKAQLPETKIYIQSILPVSQNKENNNISSTKIIAVNNELKKLCEIHNLTYIDHYYEFLDDDHYIKMEYTIDGVHLTGLGYEILISNIKQYIDE